MLTDIQLDGNIHPIDSYTDGLEMAMNQASQDTATRQPRRAFALGWVKLQQPERNPPAEAAGLDLRVLGVLIVEGDRPPASAPAEGSVA
jgi:hypothetical protein